MNTSGIAYYLGSYGFEPWQARKSHGFCLGALFPPHGIHVCPQQARFSVSGCGLRDCRVLETVPDGKEDVKKAIQKSATVRITCGKQWNEPSLYQGHT